MKQRPHHRASLGESIMISPPPPLSSLPVCPSHFHGPTGYWRLPPCLDIMTGPHCSGKARRLKLVLLAPFQVPISS